LAIEATGKARPGVVRRARPALSLSPPIRMYWPCDPHPAGGLTALPACTGSQDEYGPVRNFRAYEDATMPAFKTLDDLTDIAGKRVLVRVDLNVPVSDGKVTDATRIERVAPTIRELSKKGAKVVLLAHFGRPKGAPHAD